ncbi:hypothetical protein B0H19DRAFT_1086346 [Mycena capillaripes]|nr:hypothetical protein B0H19DRAFT_1086346 [Mycena capillaripes]
MRFPVLLIEQAIRRVQVLKIHSVKCTHAVDKGVYLILSVVSNTRITWYNISAPWVSEEKHTYPELVWVVAILLGKTDNYINVANELHIDLFHWLWSRIVQNAVNQFVRYWNTHKTRKQSNKYLPSGVAPEEVFQHPENFRLRHAGIPVHLNVYLFTFVAISTAKRGVDVRCQMSNSNSALRPTLLRQEDVIKGQVEEDVANYLRGIVFRI